VGNTEIRHNEFLTGFNVRLGLPLDSQLELGIPYRIVDQSQVTLFTAGSGLFEATTNDSASALGDVTVGIAKTLLREHGWQPDLIGRVTWEADTGKTTSNNIALGDGFNRINGSLTALKRQDPLAFTGTLLYQKSFENNNIKPGDQYNLALGAWLAASPDTSLFMQLQQSFANAIKVGGITREGTDQVSSVFVFGASSLLGRGILLQVSAGIGLTNDAPKYFINVSLPISFSIF
jgi:hypothetical protein